MKIIITLFLIYFIIRKMYINISYKFENAKYSKLVIKIYLLKKILIFKRKINNQKRRPTKYLNHVKKFVLKQENNVNIIEKLNLQIQIGTESVVGTSLAIPAISTFIALVIRRFSSKEKNCYFKIEPIYAEKNLLKINLEAFIKIKLIHIIKIVCYILKEKRDKNGKTSNRKSYGYSNAKY